MAKHEAQAAALQAVVLVGNPVNGVRIYGPFKTYDEAEEYAGNIEDAEAWTALLEEPS
jgi:hypothetical protein